jgi:type I restriction enzyme R subunit
MQTEADTRILIDRNLEGAGWQDNQIKREYPTITGPVDYCLLLDGKPIAIIEAKAKDKDPHNAIEQAQRYAKSLGLKYLYSTNGEFIYFQNLENGPARKITGFHSPEYFKRQIFVKKQSKPLNKIPIQGFLEDENVNLRNYQIECIKAIDEEIEKGRRRMFIEMATGTGKTLTMVVSVGRLMEAGKAQKILFLVDRNELAVQAHDAFKKFLGKDFPVTIIKHRKIALENQIFVATLQTMFNIYSNCETGFFDLIISDECHRSIYGEWKAVLSHFDAVQIGLTATPAKFMKRNTAEYFGEPIYKYDIKQGIKEGFLSTYRIRRIETNVDRDGLQYDGIDYKPSDLERKINVPDRNKKIIEEYKKHAKPGQKAIVFAISIKHANQICEFFNERYPEFNNNGQKFAQVITSQSENANELMQKFKNEAFPKIACTVDMLTTGFDAPKVEALLMARPTKSSMLYEQMRGRGTRLCSEVGKEYFTIFDYVGNTEAFGDQEPDSVGYTGDVQFMGKEKSDEGEKKPKQEMVIAEDVFATVIRHEYVEVGPNGDKVPVQDYCVEFEDKVREIEGKFPQIINKIKKHIALSDKENEDLNKFFDKPKYYFTEEKLQEAYNEPLVDLQKFIEVALGVSKFPSKKERVDKAFDSWLATKEFNLEQLEILEILKSRYIAGEKVNVEDFSRPPLNSKGGFIYAKEVFGNSNLLKIIDDLNNGVFL